VNDLAAGTVTRRDNGTWSAAARMGAETVSTSVHWSYNCSSAGMFRLLMSNEESGEGSALAKCDADGLGMLVISICSSSRVNQMKHCRIADTDI
jgi:hypothetical protein